MIQKQQFSRNQNNSSVQPVEIDRVDIKSAINDIEQTVGNIHIEYGANDLDLAMAGFTIKSVRESISQVMNIDPEAIPYVNGRMISDDYKLEIEDRLEFIKQSGVKG